MLSEDPRVHEGLQLLRKRRWYAAHEAIEAAWVEATGDARAFLQSLIHVAVSFEHLRRGNPRGASSQWRKAQFKLDRGGAQPYGIDLAVWRTEIAEFFTRIDLPKRVEAQALGAPNEPLPEEACWPTPCAKRP